MAKRATTRGGNGASAVVDAPEQDSRFDRRMSELLVHATDVFFERGYEGASMRYLSRASGMSLAGLYHYVDSKERLLFLIQRHAFSTIIERLHQRLQGENDPVQRLRVFIGNHLEYFLANMKAMKVLSHEDDVLRGEFGEQVQAIKRDYYRICLDLVGKARASALQSQTAGAPRVSASENQRRDGRNENRPAVVILFGMMNWLYTWYNPKIDGGAEELTAQMTSIFLHGLLHEAPLSGTISKRKQQS
jgi:TetR/AcrR family transcriptional regulator, cholesterol catabolism regulator